MGKFGKFSAVIAIVVAIGAYMAFDALVGKNDEQNIVVLQSVMGDMSVIKKSGWYLKLCGTATTHPKYAKVYFSRDTREGGASDESIPVVFNSGGTADISTYIQVAYPRLDDPILELHRLLGGDPKNIIDIIRPSMINTVKNTATLMSASAHQSARRSDFVTYIKGQLENGPYKMKPMVSEIENDDKSVTKEYSTELELDENMKPIVIEESPLKRYGFIVTQCDVTGTDYDPDTLAQFKSKRIAKNKAELAKIETQQQVQERLKLVETGKKDKQEIENKIILETTEAVLTAQKEKEMAEIEAEKNKTVAMELKLQKEVEAEQKLSVATIAKQEAEMLAAQKLAVAEFDKKIAIENAEAMKIEAEAKKEQIEKSGAITEVEKIKLELGAKVEIAKAEAIGKAVAGIKLPANVTILGGEGGATDGKGGDMIQQLMPMFMLNTIKQQTAITAPTVAPATK